MILKKPKFWDFKKPNFFAYLLYPFTIFVGINNIISSLLPKKKFTEIKTLCVGNLYIGGTGKTPTSLFLYNLLKKMNFNPVIAKKFYKNQIDEQKFLQDNSNFREIYRFLNKKNLSRKITNQDQLINYIIKYFYSKNNSKKIIKDLHLIGMKILNKTYKEINK